jgi:glycosyltransferase involved in cell wall biosynthesis
VPSLLMVTTIPGMLRGFLLPFVDHFRRRGFRVDAMAQGVGGCAECSKAFDHIWEVAWARNPLDHRNLLAARRRVRDIVADQGYDVVHVHTPVAAFVTRLALRSLRRTGRPRVIYTAHGFHFYRGGPQPRGAALRALEKLAGRWTDHLVVINREDQEAACRLLPRERVWHMPGVGVDLERYSPGAVPDSEVARVRQELGLNPEHRLFLMVAEFNPGKRHRDAVAALAHQGWAQARLALAGSGPLMEETRRLARAFGVSDRVYFLGFRPDIPALVRASVAVVLPSEREGLPRSIMESLSLGVPVIGSRIRGIVDLLEGGGGLLVPVGDVAALAEAMTRVINNPDESREMGRRGRQCMADFDLRKVIAMHEVLYDVALRGPKPAASVRSETSGHACRASKQRGARGDGVRAG